MSIDTKDPRVIPVTATADGRGQIKRASGLVDDVYSRIREDIMSLKIPPNTRISVDSMVRELGVSQTPIREALSMLDQAVRVVRGQLLDEVIAANFEDVIDEAFEFARSR